MGIASEIDSYLKKSKDVGLSKKEIVELKRLWENYQKLCSVYGVTIRPFKTLLREVKLCKKG